MKQWIGGLLATVIGGVLIYWMTVGFPEWFHPGSPKTTIPQQSFPPPRAKPARMGELQLQTNLQGGDIENIDKQAVNTAGACSELCLRNNGCKAMTFVQHPTGSGGICWLKDTVPAASRNPAMTSAIKVFD
jgi:hypothetical protein